MDSIKIAWNVMTDYSEVKYDSSEYPRIGFEVNGFRLSKINRNFIELLFHYYFVWRGRFLVGMELGGAWSDRERISKKEFFQISGGFESGDSIYIRELIDEHYNSFTIGTMLSYDISPRGARTRWVVTLSSGYSVMNKYHEVTRVYRGARQNKTTFNTEPQFRKHIFYLRPRIQVYYRIVYLGINFSKFENYFGIGFDLGLGL